ncbi:inositol monophosphatase [Nibricoccus aquaticus]|uniref:Inositol monophosphatase n=1 Tax=Nibricoccus aquaticus TaxID=2576891 RepID=A0A290QBR5_9BACT|nr:inositol monophosphatase [Nibricoccus aquaticus]ATC65964.1 inositol monophosphatase [Nibricoccus aquaticus]
MSLDLQARIEAGKAAVMAQAELMHAEFGRAQSNWKYDGTRVTAVDIAISENIVRLIGEKFPGDQVFSEELAETDVPVPVTARFFWVLDPIDGTNNYATGIAHCAISLGLFENGRPVYGLVYDMSRRVLIHGGPGIGLWDGEKPAKVKSEAPTPQSLLGFHSPFDRKYAQHASALVENFKIRGLGSSTLHLAYVAVGILDATVDHNVKIWDIAAAIPLCIAGGGEVQFLNGEQFPMTQFNLKMGRIQYVAGNAAVCAKLRGLIGA